MPSQLPHVNVTEPETLTHTISLIMLVTLPQLQNQNSLLKPSNVTSQPFGPLVTSKEKYTKFLIKMNVYHGPSNLSVSQPEEN